MSYVPENKIFWKCIALLTGSVGRGEKFETVSLLTMCPSKLT